MPAPPGTQTLASLKDQHDRELAARKPANCGAIRLRARQRAALEGVPVPSWAAKQKNALGPSQRMCRHPRSGDVVPASTQAVSTFIPSELRAWRQRTPGSVVHIGRHGITLHTPDSKRTFPSMAEAVAAVA